VSPVYYPAPETGVPLGRMYSRGIRFHAGRCHARTVIPEVAAAVAAGRLHPDVIISRRAPWRDAAEAMAEPSVKLVVERDAA
jgi:threonine dehydrogenase-like Zn-dependent dehydrogenase